MRCPSLNWVGFYFLRDGELVLGPFQGRPACVRIALGKGVCGTAAAQRRSVLVPDVEAFPGHIACDTASRSELVVPLLTGDALLGVLDLDSPVLARFDEADRAGCEMLAQVGSAAPGRYLRRQICPARGSNAFYRCPKIALPTRTQVAPQAIATSKSADMPIDSTPSPCRAARSASQAKCGRGS